MVSQKYGLMFEIAKNNKWVKMVENKCITGANCSIDTWVHSFNTLT